MKRTEDSNRLKTLDRTLRVMSTDKEQALTIEEEQALQDFLSDILDDDEACEDLMAGDCAAE